MAPARHVPSITTSSPSSEAKLIVTDSANRPKLDEVPNCPPVLVLKRNGQTRPGDGDFNSEMDAQHPEFEPAARCGDDYFGIIFTSGTTGRAKGVAYPLSALLQFAVFMRDGVDLQPDDIYWCFADPGWALGMIGTLTAPLLLGHSTVLYEGPFSVESTVRVATELDVTNMVAAPTVFRMMRAAVSSSAAAWKITSSRQRWRTSEP